MQLSTDKIPNKMLVGPEMLEIAVKEFRAMLERDCMFSKSIAYKKVAFTLQATFQFGYPIPPNHVVKSRVLADPNDPDPIVVGEVPMANPPEDTHVLSLERDVKIDNPNLARIQHDMPIIVQERLPPQPNVPVTTMPGEEQAPPNPFPEIKNHKLKYDKTQYPQGDPPVDRDMSEQAAERLKGKPRNKA